LADTTRKSYLLLRKPRNSLEKGAFSPTEAARKAQQLTNVALSPGGGLSGEIFIQQALGLGNPNLEAQKRAAGELGINQNLVRRRTFPEYLRAKEDPILRTNLLRAHLKGSYPGDFMPAYMLHTLGRGQGIGFTAAEKIIGGLGGGISNMAGIGGIQGAAAVGRGDTRGMMGIDPKMITVLNKYHESLATLAGIPGGVQGIKDLAELIRTFQVLGGTAVAVTFTEIFAPALKALKEMMANQDQPMKDVIKTEIQAISAYVKEFIRKALNTPTTHANPTVPTGDGTGKK